MLRIQRNAFAMASRAHLTLRHRTNYASSFVTSKIDDTSGKRPRAVVLVLGFGGAQHKHLLKYAQLYNSKGCSTVSATASNYDIFIDHRGLDGFANNAVQQVTTVIREAGESSNGRIPIVIHIMSNGGAFVVRKINELLDASGRKKEMNNELELFANGLKVGCQIFDSAPCFLDRNSSFNVIKHLIPNPIIGTVSAMLFSAISSIPYILSTVTGKSTPGDIFWNDLLEDTNCTRQAFIYTHLDPIANSQKIEEFINGRKKRGVNVMKKHFEGSAHVQHLKLHEHEYSNFVDMALSDMEENNGAGDAKTLSKL